MYMPPIDMDVHSPGKACVLCNGEFGKPETLKLILDDCDLLIAADGGAEHFKRLGRVPNVIIGDMDSIDVDAWMGKDGISYVRFPQEKKKTDTELAVEYAMDHGCKQVLLAAATGGRLDHTLGNIALIAHYPGRVALLENNATLVAVDKSETCVLHGKVGTLVSLIPYRSDKPRVRTKGLRYSLDDECLTAVTHGLSNTLAESEACIWVWDGIVLVYIENQGCPGRDAKAEIIGNLNG